MACEVCHKIYAPDEDKSDGDVKPHLCLTCGHSFSLKIQLKRHAILHADNVPFTCINCAKASDDRRKTYNFRLGSKNEYICDVCQKCFANKRMLLRHSIQHTLDKLSDAEEMEYDERMPKKSVTVNKRKYSRKNCDKKELLSCSMCSRTFVTWLALEKHTLSHSKPKSSKIFNCKFCNKEFIYQAALEKHVLKNKCNKPPTVDCKPITNQGLDQEDKKHACNICGKTFARKSSLDGHEISHIIDKLSTDEEKEFSDAREKLSDSEDKPNLKTDEEFYVVKENKSSPKADKEFPVIKENKLFHKKKKKMKYEDTKSNFSFNFEKTYMCDKCNFVCFSQSTLDKHSLNHEEKESIFPDVTSKSEDNSTYVPPIKLKWRKQRIQRSKNYVCEVCGRRFAGQICFQKHKLKHENEKTNIKDIPVNPPEKKIKRTKPVKELICEYCEEVFTGRKAAYVKHMHAHTPEVCGICDERFVDRQSLREHCKIHVGTEEGRMFMQCSQKALDAKNGLAQPEPKVEYIYLVLR